MFNSRDLANVFRTDVGCTKRLQERWFLFQHKDISMFITKICLDISTITMIEYQETEEDTIPIEI